MEACPARDCPTKESVLEDPGQCNGEWIAALLQQYERPLLRYAWRLLGDADAARDVVQDTFLRLSRAQPEEVASHPSAWLYRVCRHRATDRIRKESRMSSLPDHVAESSPCPAPSPDEAALERERDDQLQRLVASLPERQQQILQLKFQDGLRYRQIGEVMGLTPTNVGYLVHTAVATLRKQLAALEADV
jgi:RNA polymerase sigma-70 factor (ECF subfamily)